METNYQPTIYLIIMNAVLQFIPICLVLFYGFYGKFFVTTFRSSLGRLIIILIIVLYTAYHKLLGLIAALLSVLFFMQTDTYIEAMETMDKPVTDKPVTKPTTDTKPTTETKPTTDTKPNSMDDRDVSINSRNLPIPALEPFEGWEPYQEKTIF
jgi:hypothetical protein